MFPFKKWPTKPGQPPQGHRDGLLKHYPPNLGKTYQDGELIIQEGEIIENMYVIQMGRVLLFRDDAYGNRIPLNTLKTGDMISDLSVFDQTANLVSAAAMGEARVLTIDKKTLVQRVYEDPALILYLFERMAKQTKHLHAELISYILISNRLIHLMGEPLEERTATPLQRMTLQIAQQLLTCENYKEEINALFLECLGSACMLYDIGNAGISKEILESNKKLTPEEFRSIQLHVTTGAQILIKAAQQNTHIRCFDLAAEVAEFHHEQYDGSGYHGIVGEAIPLSARLVSVVDVYGALRSDRPHRPAWSKEKAVQFIRDHAGTLFDPHIVQAFLQVVSEEDFFDKPTTP